MSKSLLLAVALTAAIALPVAAQKTAVEAVHLARKDGANCTPPNNDFGHMYWHRGDGPIRIVGEGSEELEFWGHFMDMSGSASLPGIPGVSATFEKGRGGAENGSAQCQRIGSAVVRITIDDPVDTPRSGTLSIGNERLPVIIQPRIAMDVKWSEYNLSRASSLPGTPPPLTPAQIQAIHARYNDCVTARTNRQNNPGSGPHLLVPGALTCEEYRDVALRLIPNPQGRSSGYKGDSKTLVRCAEESGLSTTLYPDQSTLIVNLPDNRAGLMECLRGRENFLTIDIDHAAEGRDFHFFRVTEPNNLRMTASGTYPTVWYSRVEAPTVGGRFHKATLNLQELGTLIGSYERTLRFTPSDGSTLTLILQSQTPYGVKAVNAPIFPQGVGRLNSDISLRVETHQAIKAGQTFNWSVLPGSGGSAAGCFEAVNGSITPPAGPATFALPLTVKENAGCVNRDYRVHVTVASANGSGLYGRDVTFTLPGRSQIRGTGNITDGVKIQGQTPLIRP